MKIYVGVTDSNWYKQLKAADAKEVNFWAPGNSGFKALKENELFLFKLHSPDNYIVGGGFFVSYSSMPIETAWKAFELQNGVTSRNELYDRIRKYRSKNNKIHDNEYIGCTILTDVFYFDRPDWIPSPDDWSMNIVKGKGYDTATDIGWKLYQDVQIRLQGHSLSSENLSEADRYTTSLTKHRIGQSAFRVLVMDAYQKSCAISGEKTLPVLQAAHIKPYASEGPHQVSNGIFLRSDIHTLFDAGYITIDPDYTIDVSQRLHQDYGNGKDYYKFDGQKLLVLPEDLRNIPSKEYLEWHNKNVFIER